MNSFIPSIALHFVARTLYPLRPFTDRETSLELWNRLHRNFPEAHAAVIMPNHFHIILPVGAGEPRLEYQYRQRIGGLLLHFTKYLGKTALWEPIPPTREISSRSHLARQIRYVHLNPIRGHLVHDALEWEFNTYTDWMEASLSPWRDFSSLRRQLGFKNAAALERFHHFVDSDESPNSGPEEWMSDLAYDKPRAPSTRAPRIADAHAPLITWPEVVDVYLRLHRISAQKVRERTSHRLRLLGLLRQEMNAPAEILAALTAASVGCVHNASYRFRKNPPSEYEKAMWRRALHDPRLHLRDIRR